MPTPQQDRWTAAREAVALGVSLKEAADSYGLGYERLRKRAQREQWPQPAKLATLAHDAAPPSVPPSQVAAQSWADRGEQHRAAVFKLASEALAKAKPRRLEEWADIERAARLADRAAGLDKPAPVVSLHFPQVQSSEPRPVFDLSADPATMPPALDL
jgi:hypothetical protein